MSRFTLRVPQAADWRGFTELVATLIPNYLVSQLGPRFGAVYYRHLARQPNSPSWRSCQRTTARGSPPG